MSRAGVFTGNARILQGKHWVFQRPPAPFVQDFSSFSGDRVTALLPFRGIPALFFPINPFVFN
jgi:hypothetical protein